MNYRYFVTGTDTDVGKTFVSAALLARAGRKGMHTSAFKPVAAGADRDPGGLRNSDALTLIEAINQPMDYEAVNPLCYEEAIAPHIAARRHGESLDVSTVMAAGKGFMQTPSDFSLVEGAGGWRVPLNEKETFADLAVAMELPVILVVAMRLGCINHALLTVEAIATDGLRLAGWVANQAGNEEMDFYRENLDTLSAMIDAPLLGAVPFIEGGDYRQAANALVLPDHLEDKTPSR